MTRFDRLLWFRARLQRQNEFSNTSLKTKDANTNGCLIDVIITLRHTSCIITPTKLIAGIPSEPKVWDVMASALYSNTALQIKKMGIRSAWTTTPDWKKSPPRRGYVKVNANVKFLLLIVPVRTRDTEWRYNYDMHVHCWWRTRFSRVWSNLDTNPM